MLLAVEGVGLVERDLVPVARHLAQEAAIIGGRAVPVGRQKARTVEGDLHCAASRPTRRHAAQARDDLLQLLRAMRARVPRADRLEARARKVHRQARLPEDVEEHALHLVARARDEVVRARPEQALAIVPRRADQRNAARQRLEHADRRDAGQRLAHRDAAAHARSRDSARTAAAHRHWRSSRDIAGPPPRSRRRRRRDSARRTRRPEVRARATGSIRILVQFARSARRRPSFRSRRCRSRA